VDTETILLDKGVRVVCQLSGAANAPTMVLLHALGEQATSWQDVSPRFTTSFRVVALDLRGHGASDWPGMYSFELMRDDVLGVLDHLDLRDIILIGHSMGGTVEAGQDVSWDADFPGFRRVYAHDPFGNRLEFLQPASQ